MDIDYSTIEDGISLNGEYKFLRTTEDKGMLIVRFITEKIASGEADINQFSQLIVDQALKLGSKDNVSALSLELRGAVEPTTLVVCDEHGKHSSGKNHRTSQKVIEGFLRYNTISKK